MTRLLARFAHKEIGENVLPTHWTFPGLDKMEGAQCFSIGGAIHVIENDGVAAGWEGDSTYGPDQYSGVYLIKASATSGECGPFSAWPAVLESDIEEIHFISYDEIAGELWMLKEEGKLDDMSDEDIFEYLVDARGAAITPVFVDTLAVESPYDTPYWEEEGYEEVEW